MKYAERRLGKAKKEGAGRVKLEKGAKR